MKLKLITSFLAVILLLAGCMGTNANEEGRGMRGKTNLENTRNQDGTNQNRNLTENVNNRNDMHNNAGDGNNMRNNNRNEDNYEVSGEAADRIVSEINEIESAYVLTSNRMAYVATRLDTNNNKGTDHNRSVTETSDQGNLGDRNNVGNATTSDRGNSDMTRNGEMGEGHEVTDEVKDKITKIVQSIDPEIKNVYVTTSPDFVDLVNNYSDDMDNGKPIRGMFDQIGNMIERVFPQNNR